MKCCNCRYWSELIAIAEGGAVKALCLNGLGVNAGKYTTKLDGCRLWASGHHGSVDDPESGERARRLYDEESQNA